METETAKAATDFGTSMMPWIALAAVIVGPAISLVVTKMQIRSQLVSTSRLEWINSLRSEMADFLALFTIHSGGTKDRTEYQRLLSILNMIILRMNPNEEAHMTLVHNMQALIELVFDEQSAVGQEEEIARLYELVRSSARAVMKAEWERIKKGR